MYKVSRDFLRSLIYIFFAISWNFDDISYFREGNPVVDYDLLAAMAQLTPGEDHMLHPSHSGMISISVTAFSILAFSFLKCYILGI